ncbi:hypothetical protein [Paenibacillus tepidiphilus]|uniref:hypothetical protein n=1 Tax=Paenibacillus tepidiphilus TaxID=2608683 RepID=UPI0012385539|nr:hypothetical protein [Paenibacillus tepidiphilus]
MKKYMGQTMLKAALATSMLFVVVPFQQNGITRVTASAAGAVASAGATTAPKPTAAPIMRDNLSKYGLEKVVDLPVTITAGGFSYTLEKIMIYESASKTAQELIKKYGYYGDEKYFIWTKISIENNSKSVLQFSSKDLSDKWRLYFGEMAFTNMPQKLVKTVNSKDALWTWKLNPGQKLSTYQAFLYDDVLGKFYISLHLPNNQTFKVIAQPKGN